MPGTPTPLGYRLYPINAAGHIAGPPVEFSVTTDEEAVEAAVIANVIGPHELWNGARMVRRFDFTRQQKTIDGQDAKSGNH